MAVDARSAHLVFSDAGSQNPDTLQSLLLLQQKLVQVASEKHVALSGSCPFAEAKIVTKIASDS